MLKEEDTRSQSNTGNFVRYLEAKRGIDDRALNRYVYGQLARRLAKVSLQRSLDVLEIGSGIGSMLTRLLEWGLLLKGSYTLVDADKSLMEHAVEYIGRWAEVWGYEFRADGEARRLIGRSQQDLRVEFVTAEAEEFLKREAEATYDLTVAHAFLDLVDIKTVIPGMIRGTKPGGFLYLTVNFDGNTVFTPEIDAALDGQIEKAYHATMDNRQRNGRPAGEAHTGRHLPTVLLDNEVRILAGGSSDWVIIPAADATEKYPEDEAFFLHFILGTIENSLRGEPVIDSQVFSDWMATRRRQVEHGELMYMAHQIDWLAERPLF